MDVLNLNFRYCIHQTDRACLFQLHNGLKFWYPKSMLNRTSRGWSLLLAPHLDVHILKGKKPFGTVQAPELVDMVAFDDEPNDAPRVAIREVALAMDRHLRDI